MQKFVDHYEPDMLFAVERKWLRDEVGILGKEPFSGCDILTAYELSWLDSNGKPNVAVAEIIIAANSFNALDIKSLRMYLLSFSESKFNNIEEVAKIIQKDIGDIVGTEVGVKLIPQKFFVQQKMMELTADALLDDLEIKAKDCKFNPQILKIHDKKVKESVVCNLLKFNCPVTEEPRQGSIKIFYEGQKICHKALLAYLISHRNCAEYFEQCVEKIYMDILNYCKVTKLAIVARFLRYDGVDANVFRANCEFKMENARMYRQ